MADIPEAVGKVLHECELGKEAVWQHKQSGSWIVKHWALERAAAHKGIVFDQPTVVHADPANKLATLVVTGHLGDKTEWSFGEAAPYNTQQTYPFAMAEKRGKDRVILKLIGLHGLAYSEEEADDFKNSAPKQESAPAQPEAKPAAKQEPQKPEPVDWHEYAKGLRKAILTSPTEQALDEVLDVNRDNMTKLKTVSQPASDAINEAINSRRATLKEAA